VEDGKLHSDDWLDVAAVEDLPQGAYEVVETDDVILAVFNVGGRFFAIEDICTHDGEELTGGPVDGDQIICPRHGARFCLRTGKALTPPAYEDLRTFPVRVRDGRLEVLPE
jgi:3-phenylpropionate/trans-cinnamate dioxygenase ferredoxin subunit